MDSPKRYKVIDLFCGTGALSYGLASATPRFTTVAGIDIDRAATETARANHQSALIVCDRIESMPPEDLVSHAGVSSVDVIVGGPPCQGFSSLRPSRGTDLEDPRNHLYRQFIKYVADLRPSVFVMENVIGLVNDTGGNLLQQILRGFRDVGYAVDWRILNAAHYGVPQKRERFFLIGIKRSVLAKRSIEFPSPSHYFSGRVIGTRHKSKHVKNKDKGMRALGVWDAISDLPSLQSGERADQYSSPPLNEYQAERRVNENERLTLHVAANHSRKMLEVMRHAGTSISSIPQGMITSGYSSCYSRLEPDEPSTTITVKFTSPASSKCIHPKDHRSITPREAARIQSFDDDFVFCGSKTDIATQIGNAVPPLFGKALAPVLERLLESRASRDEW